MADDAADTTTLHAAREHARGQAGRADAGVGTGVTLPVSAASDLPDDVPAATWDETIGPGNYTARRLARGTILRVADQGGDACVQLLVYNARLTSERLNVADTVKVQWQAYLAEDSLLLSDLGRVLMTVVADTSTRHDCLCGTTTMRSATAKYGGGSMSGPTPCGRDLLTLAAAKHGLGRGDVGPNVNLFKGVRVEADGRLTFDGESVGPTHVDLQAEMDVIVLVSNTPHPLDPRAAYTSNDVRLTAWLPPAPVDRARHTSPERNRAFLNTEDHRLEMEP